MRHRSVVAVLCGLAVPAVTVALSVWLLASEAYLRWEYGRPGFPSAPGISDAQRLELATPSTLFLTRPGISAEDLAALQHEGAPLYTAGEIQHLVDVRDVVGWVSRAGVAGLVLLAVGTIFALRRRAWRPPVGRGLRAGGVGTVLLLLLVAGAVAAAWPVFFVLFHQVLFDPGTWQFPVDSGLIRLFPEQFWFDTAVVLVILTGVLALLIAAVGHVMAASARPRGAGVAPHR